MLAGILSRELEAGIAYNLKLWITIGRTGQITYPRFFIQEFI